MAISIEITRSMGLLLKSIMSSSMKVGSKRINLKAKAFLMILVMSSIMWVNSAVTLKMDKEN